MANDPSIECVDSHVFTGGSTHATVKVMGLTAMLVVIPITLAVFYAALSPIRNIMENRIERTCSPLVDFAISRWRPHMWQFALGDIVRRIICTSGLLVMPDVQSQCLFACILSVLFTTLYREQNPYW